MAPVTMSDEDRAELARLCARVAEYARAVEERDRYMVLLYDGYRADPMDLLAETGIKARSQLYDALHRYGSTRVKLRTHRPVVRDQARKDEQEAGS